MVNDWYIIFDKNKPELNTVLKDLAIYCNVHKTSYDVASPYQTAFNEGMRDVFLHILQMSSINIEQILKLLAEHNHNSL